jgi:hypothetical protein
MKSITFLLFFVAALPVAIVSVVWRVSQRIADGLDDAIFGA